MPTQAKAINNDGTFTEVDGEIRFLPNNLEEYSDQQTVEHLENHPAFMLDDLTQEEIDQTLLEAFSLYGNPEMSLCLNDDGSLQL